MKSEIKLQSEPVANPLSSGDVIDALHRVMSDVESFMGNWLDKVQCELALTNPDAAEATLRRGFQGLEAEKRRWKAKQQCELDSIERKAEQLTKAWLKLETEQRQLLRQQDKTRTTRRSTVPEAHQLADEELGDSSTETPLRPTRRTTNSLGSGKQARNGSLRSMTDSVRQFQQLRREIEMTRAGS